MGEQELVETTGKKGYPKVEFLHFHKQGREIAGKKQHDLPRLLLRGFAEVEGEAEFVWLFRKDTEPKRVSIQDVGHSKFFYDKPGSGTLDAFITNKENEYGAFVAQLRRERRLRSSDEETLIEFVHSLVLRTRNLRDLLIDAFDTMRKQEYNASRLRMCKCGLVLIS